jgi:hypothetical protein
MEDRWDFNSKDGSIWPMYVHKGGELFGFCPAKATWDPGTQELYKMLLVAAETGALYYDGGIADQPYWFIDLLAWFLPRYDSIKFEGKARSVLGDGSKKPGSGQVGGNQRSIKR